VRIEMGALYMIGVVRSELWNAYKLFAWHSRTSLLYYAWCLMWLC